MKEFISSALALTAIASVGAADPGGDSEWLELDSEITSLASTLSTQGDGSGWSALLRSTYNFSSGDLATAGGPDISGFSLEDVDLAFWGGVGDYAYRVSFDMDDGNADLEDAYVHWPCGEYFDATMGQYKAKVYQSNAVDPEDQLFIDRTILGSAFDGWELGVGASGDYEEFRWNIDVQNGSNGDQSDHRYVIRGEYLFGLGAGPNEGALNGNDDFNAMVGAVYVHDDSLGMGLSNAQLWGLDINGQIAQFGFGGEIAFLDEDYLLTTASDFDNLAFGIPLFDPGDDIQPFSLTGSYLINEEFEAGIRYEDADNFDDNKLYTAGLNWYQSGENAKWQAQVTRINSDIDNTTVFQVGYSVGASR